MYQPRHASDVQPEAVDQVDTDSAFVKAPRRSAAGRASVLRTRVAPIALSAVMLFGVAAFAVNLNAQGATDTTVAAPARVEDSTSRSTERTEAELVSETPADATETPAPEATEEAAGTETTEGGDAAAETTEAESAPVTFAVGSWESSFGKIVGDKYAQAKVTVRADASADSSSLGSLASGDKVSATDSVVNGFRQVNYNGKLAWVADSRLGDAAPVVKTPAPAAAPASSGSTSRSSSRQATSSSESYNGSTSYSGKSVLGLKPQAMVVYNAVTAKWSFTAIGGYRASSLSNHQLGGAIDFMTYSDSAKGWEVANYLAANASAFNIDHIIFQQKIWTPYKPYWRGMSDRGSATANHMDHVHVSVKL